MLYKFLTNITDIELIKNNATVGTEISVELNKLRNTDRQTTTTTATTKSSSKQTVQVQRRQESSPPKKQVVSFMCVWPSDFQYFT
jgi:hypothetical protein